MEACPFVEWFIDRFRDCVERIDIADATELANRRGKRRKTDCNDVAGHRRALSRGECPLGFIADEELMQLRKLGRHWRQFSRLLSRSKHSMKIHAQSPPTSAARSSTAPPPSAGSWPTATCLSRSSNKPSPISSTSCMLIERHRERLRREIIFATRSERFAPDRVAAHKRARHRRDLGGIIAAEIGPFDRFPNADALEFWAGLTADMKESAGRTQSGNITKAGSATLALGLVPGGRHPLPVRRPAGSDPPATRSAGLGQAQGQRRHGPAAAAHPVRHDPRRKDLSSEDPARDRTAAANKARAKRLARKKGGRLTPETQSMTCGGIFVMSCVGASDAPGTFRRVGDRDQAFIRPSWQRCFSLVEKRPGIAGQRNW